MLVSCIAAITAADLRAQAVSAGGTGTGPTPADASSPGEVQAGPERVIVTDVPIEASILPTTRPYTSAFGLDDNILDVPRNVTIISREQLDSIAISDVRDFPSSRPVPTRPPISALPPTRAFAVSRRTCSSTASAAA